MDVEETVDAIADVVKETAEETDSAVVPIIVGLVSLGIGLGIGYILGRRNKFEVIKLGDRPITKPPKVIIDIDDEEPEVELHDDEVRVVEVVKEKEVSVTVNDKPLTERRTLFADGDPDEWDLKEEMKKRDPLTPFIVHRDEFFAEDPATEHYIQSQLTYYEGDEVLVDDDWPTRPIYDVSSMVGTIVWGHGSGDPNICYVRNMSQAQEYEIKRDPGHHRIEVLGLEMEAEAEEKAVKATKVRRMRPE